MNPKKPVARKSKSAGISLEPSLIKQAKEFSEKNGFGSLSNYVRFLLTQELKRLDTGERLVIETASPPSFQRINLFNENPGNAEAHPRPGADANVTAAGNIFSPSQNSAGGSSIRPTTMKYPKGGRRKLST
jgi:hypothetical protein